MIGTDTNILLRGFLQDDPVQLSQVRDFLTKARDSHEPVLVTTIVLCETVWNLRSKGRRRAEIAQIIEDLLGSDVFLIEHNDLVGSAVASYRAGKGDFADYLIAEVNQAKGCRYTVTFDSDLLDEPGFKPVSKR